MPSSYDAVDVSASRSPRGAPVRWALAENEAPAQPLPPGSAHAEGGGEGAHLPNAGLGTADLRRNRHTKSRAAPHGKGEERGSP